MPERGSERLGGRDGRSESCEVSLPFEREKERQGKAGEGEREADRQRERGTKELPALASVRSS